MIKINKGWIKNNVTGETKDIIVKAISPNSLKDSLIGSGIVLIGITYLTVSAFKNGIKVFENAENDVLDSLGLLH